MRNYLLMFTFENRSFLSVRVLICILSITFYSYSQEVDAFNSTLRNIPGIVSVRQLTNSNFKGSYEVIIRQKVDHFSDDTSTFDQRLMIGLRAPGLPVMLVTDGYSIDHAVQPAYKCVESEMLNTNVIVSEQRYTGQSILRDTSFRFLSMNSIAADCHVIYEMLHKVFPLTWMTLGISKGGQSALTCVMNYPSEFKGAIVFGTPVRNEFNDGRINEYQHGQASIKCSRSISTIQQHLFQNKKAIVTMIGNEAMRNNIKFNLPYSTVADHLILELPFSFLQLGISCDKLPAENSDIETLYSFLTSVVPIKSFSAVRLKRLAHAYYLAAYELGYYEYDKGGFGKFLSDGSVSMIDFNTIPVIPRIEYLERVSAFLRTNPSNVIFIYGQNDPYAGLKPDVKNVYIAKDKAHKVFLDELASRDQKEIKSLVKSWLN